MVLTSSGVLVVAGLVMWLVPWPPSATKLNEVGKWTFLIALSTFVGLFH